MSLSWSTTPAVIRFAGVAAILGFVVTIESTSSRTINGRLAECSYTNFGALLLGALALVAGLVGVVAARKIVEQRTVLMAIAAGSALIGVLHILRGLGSIGGPCNV
jgi:hypothetical protein